MQQAELNQKIAYGLAKAASIVGAQESLYRPTSVSSPIDGTPFAVINCAYDVTPDFRLIATASAEHAYASLLADPTLVQPGDYLVGENIHFIARVEPLRPALCVLCTMSMDFLDSDVSTSAGTNAYGGRTAATDTAIAESWPVSVVPRSRAGTDITKLPSDTRSAFYEVLLPPIPGLMLTYGMRLRDEIQQEYEIISADLSPFGWKLLVGLATT